MGMRKSSRTQRRNKCPTAVMNAQSIERQRIGGRKRSKRTGEQEKVSGIERKGSDNEEWRQSKISGERSVITEGGRQTAFFFTEK